MEQRSAKDGNSQGLTRVNHEDNELLEALAKVNDAPPPAIPPSAVWYRLNPFLRAAPTAAPVEAS